MNDLMQSMKNHLANSMQTCCQSAWFVLVTVIIANCVANGVCVSTVAAADYSVVDSDIIASAIATEDFAKDRLWLIDTRSITSNASCADIQSPMLSVFRLDECGQASPSSIEDYLGMVSQSPAVVLYAHGNRLDSAGAIERGLTVYRRTRMCSGETPIDWVIWSWPSEKQGILAKDARLKASRTDAQGLYMAWLLKRHAEYGVPTSMIGYSFGGRVITGALHAAAGGKLAGRSLDGPAVTGMQINAGLVAPAIEDNWMQQCGYHSESTKNLNRLVLFYNHRDAVLKRYWLINRVRGQTALGYSGPQSFAARIDGTRLPVESKDCAPTVGKRHNEVDYYMNPCRAGQKMSLLIDDLFLP